MAGRDRLKLASQRAEEFQRSILQAVSARYDRERGQIVIDLSSKLAISFRPQDAQGLEKANPSDLDEIEITPSGLGIHFPKLDVDLYVPALLEGCLGSNEWMASRTGRVGGQSRSQPKKAAARAKRNRGGRPKKASSR
jgi:Protein of unknown function (DUF2442)